MTSTPTEQIRIHKYMAQAGICSRREAEQIIVRGSVTLNGQVVTEPGAKMTPGADKLEVDGELIRFKPVIQTSVYALYKPKNCVTTLKDPQGRMTIKHFFPPENKRFYPVGRLDYDAEGLLLITNDGDFCNKITHPKFKIWKSYFVKVKGIVTPENLRDLKKGPVINKKKHLPVKAKILHNVNNNTWLEVTLQQGTNHQIKNMFLQMGFLVEKIKRFSIGNIHLGEMNPGEYRKLSPEEIADLLKLVT
ncbi:MAG: rRNA pseudouridine synthase [SAR324 cluster bacterium]|nr:rRNA pseudouridine synthase [SAR324 cluster bacterium]